MSFKTEDHSDLRLFRNRLWHLMASKNIDEPKILATALYDAGLVKVNRQKKESFSDEKTIYNNDILAVTKKIRVHLRSDTPEKLQGEFLVAYCTFFDCSADYLLLSIPAPTHKASEIMAETGLSEESINVLLTAYKNSTHIPPAIDDGNIITALDYLLKYNYSILKDIGEYLTQKVSDINVYGDYEQYEAGETTKSKVTKNIHPEDIEMVDVLKIQSKLADLRSDIRSGKSIPVNKLEDKTDHKEFELW